MGHRSTIIIDHDVLDQLDNPDAGKLIKDSVLKYSKSPVERRTTHIGSFGRIVETGHVDTVRLGIIGPNGSFSFHELASRTIYAHSNDVTLHLLREAAATLGYKLIKDNG